MMSSHANLGRLIQQAYSGWSGSAGVNRVLQEFPDLSVYIAGGTVRNRVLDPHGAIRDFDLFLDGPRLHSVMERLGQLGCMERGIYGNRHWMPHNGGTIRGDLIFIRNFKTVCPSFTILDVLNQFDFTGNAIAVDVRSGCVLNPHHGIEDLENRIMRGIRFDFPDKPISPGHALTSQSSVWFRILHYAAALRLQIEPITMRWLQAHRHFAAYRETFIKTFKCPHPDAFWVGERAWALRPAW